MPQVEENKNPQIKNKPSDISAKLQSYINSIAKREKYVTFESEIKNVSSNGGSYMGLLHDINIKGKTERGEKETKVFMKHILYPAVPLTFNVTDVYKREHFVYTNLMKDIFDMQEEYQVPVEDRYQIAEVFDECNEETIILENLVARGFKTYYRMDVINFEYAVLCIKHLARLHGLSFALQLKKPECYEKKIKTINCLYFLDENWNEYIRNMCTFSSQFLNDDEQKKVVPLFGDIVVKYADYFKEETGVNTICHGDFRANNIMVKEVNGKPVEVIAVDYQIAHIGNPVLDFIYFIFWGTDQEFRRNHLEYLKELYHQYLGTFLKYFDINVEDVFPKEEYERLYKEKLDYGLMISIFYLPFLFPPEDNIPNILESEETINNIRVNVDPKYGERFRGIVDDFIKWGYLSL